LLGFESALLLGECRVEVGTRGGLSHTWARRCTLRLGNGLRTWARCRGSRATVGRVRDRAALAFGDLALDLFADLAGPLGARTGRTFFVVKLSLGPGLPALALAFVRGFLLLARV